MLSRLPVGQTAGNTSFELNRGRSSIGGWPNESTWLKTPPPPEVVAWTSQAVGASLSPLTGEEWVTMLESAGVREIVASVHAIGIQDEAKGILRRYGFGGMLRVFWRIAGLYLRNPAYRRFVRGVREQGMMPENLDEYFGYGLYVGRK